MNANNIPITVTNLKDLSRLIQPSINTGSTPVIILLYHSQCESDVFRQNCFRYHFTSRETEIADLIIQGKAQKDIAYILHISAKTVAKHVQNIYYKLKVNNKMEFINKLTFP